MPDLTSTTPLTAPSATAPVVHPRCPLCGGRLKPATVVRRAHDVCIIDYQCTDDPNHIAIFKWFDIAEVAA